MKRPPLIHLPLAFLACAIAGSPVSAQTGSGAAGPRLSLPAVIRTTGDLADETGNRPIAVSGPTGLPENAAPASAGQVAVAPDGGSAHPAQTVAAAASPQPPAFPDLPLLPDNTGLTSPAMEQSRALREEMIGRMRRSVEQIASEYGNPVFTQIFTNDTVRAQLLRERMYLLTHFDALAAKIEELTKEKAAAEQQAETARRRLESLRTEASELRRRNNELRSGAAPRATTP
ncbi:hypothetical protein OPIT5_04660 [Opitutaceae bacterium TAV5]|nr:hypothetical protein OPIT5_04660 [Opitutaceae bacterium TAV5]